MVGAHHFAQALPAVHLAPGVEGLPDAVRADEQHLALGQSRTHGGFELEMRQHAQERRGLALEFLHGVRAGVVEQGRVVARADVAGGALAAVQIHGEEGHELPGVAQIFAEQVVDAGTRSASSAPPPPAARIVPRAVAMSRAARLTRPGHAAPRRDQGNRRRALRGRFGTHAGRVHHGGVGHGCGMAHAPLLAPPHFRRGPARGRGGLGLAPSLVRQLSGRRVRRREPARRGEHPLQL